jgi:hypothetical protein
MTTDKFNYHRIKAMEECIKKLEVKASILEVNNMYLKDRLGLYESKVSITEMEEEIKPLLKL